MTEGGALEVTLRAAQAGAEWAVTDLYRRHAPGLVRYLRARAPREFEDIASSTWLDAARNLRSFTGGEDAFAGWLFTIARRRLVDHRRAAGRRPLDPAEATAFAGLTSPSAEDAALSGNLGDEGARRIVELLSDDQAEVVLLRVVAGLDVDAVAKITGRRPGAVRVMQHRALKRLAKELAEIGNESKEQSDGTQRDAHSSIPPR